MNLSFTLSFINHFLTQADDYANKKIDAFNFNNLLFKNFRFMTLYNLNRFHVFVFVTWQFALIFILQNLFPIFSNFIPRWQCFVKNATTASQFSNDCRIYNACPKKFLRFEEVFYSTAVEFQWICHGIIK